MDGRIRFEYGVIAKRVDVDIFVSGKKKLRIQKYLDTCGRGLNDSFSRKRELYELVLKAAVLV